MHTPAPHARDPFGALAAALFLSEAAAIPFAVVLWLVLDILGAARPILWAALGVLALATLIAAAVLYRRFSARSDFPEV